MSNSNNNVKMVKLGEVCEIIAGQSPPSSTYNDEGVGLPFFQGKTDFGERHPVVRKWCSDPLKIAKDGDILISVRAPVGPTNVATEKCCIGRGLSAIRCPDSVYMEYLLHFLRWFESRLSAQGKGAVFSAITQKDLKAIYIPLPPLPEQRRIAEILDGADEARRKRRENLSLYDDLIRSLFLKTFGDPVSNPMGWEVGNLREFISILGGFAFKSSGFKKTGIPIIKIGTVNKGSFDISNCSFWGDLDEKLKKFIISPGDLLMSLTGTVGKDDYGNIAIANASYDQYLLNQRVAKIEVNDGLNKTYLQYCFKNEKLKGEVIKLSRGIRQANISNADIYSLRLAIPPISIQNIFSIQVREINAQKSREQVLYDQHDDLFNALLQRAFKGELGNVEY